MTPVQQRDSSMENLCPIFHAALENAAIGLLVVRSDMRFISANRYMLQEFSLPPHLDSHMACPLLSDNAPTNIRFQCGQMCNCENCTIKNTLYKILHDVISVEGIALSNSRSIRGNIETKWFLLSGSRFLYDNEIYGILSFVDITFYKDREQHLMQKLDLDLSTNTLNKHSLLQRIDELVLAENKRHFTICMMDFDSFKEINDRHGHIMGDKVLCTFSQISKGSIRANDIVGRYGGEEFVFLFPDTGLNEAIGIVIRIQKELQEHFAGLLPFSVSFSAGMLHVDKKACKALTSTELISQVDKLMYQAKEHGKNRLVTASGEFLFSKTF